jgi:hypothetical protein
MRTEYVKKLEMLQFVPFDWKNNYLFAVADSFIRNRIIPSIEQSYFIEDRWKYV